MENKTRNIILITGVVLMASAIGFGIYSYFKNKNEQDTSDTTNEDEVNPYVPKSSVTTSSDSNTGVSTSQPSLEDTQTDNESSDDLGLIQPRFNTENELSNSLSQLKGRYLYPKRQAIGGWGYSNVRSSPEVNTDQGWWDPSDNLITTINSGTPIGQVVSQTTGLFNGYSYRWFRVKLLKPVGGWFSDYTHGFVRADTVTIKPY